MSSRFDKLLVLDLDETLIYSTKEPLDRPADFRAGLYHTYKRPHVDRFLEVCSSWFKLAVWTSGSSTYAAEVIRHLFPDSQPLAFVFGRRRCTCPCDARGWDVPEPAEVKRLSRVKARGYPLSKVLVVDDTPGTFRRNYGNGIAVSEYRGDTQDNELLDLLVFLEYLGPMEDVRTIEKRGWRDRFSKH